LRRRDGGPARTVDGDERADGPGHLARGARDRAAPVPRRPPSGRRSARGVARGRVLTAGAPACHTARRRLAAVPPTRAGSDMGGSRSGFPSDAAIPRLTAAMAVTLFLGLPAHARADLVAGRGRNCGAAWDTFTAVTTESRKGSTLICADGDASCDADGETNGVCVVRLNACVGQ